MFGKLTKKLFICALFAISMAYLESAVVVYLRAIYYPGGFAFPMVDILPFHLGTEIGRETATLVMLWAVSQLIANNRREWFAYFSFNFAVWDIWYYIWLKFLLNWPQTLMDWDILFLVPLPWVGPVLAPVLVSLGLITASVIILKYENKEKPLRIGLYGWLMEIVAGLIIIASFCVNSTSVMNRTMPQSFPWWLFLTGMGLGTGVFIWNNFKFFQHSRWDITHN